LHGNKYLTILILLISTLFVFSCKLFSPDETDNSPPEIDVTIAGGTEISRGVTLYLDIEDDSKIDYVSVMIDDTAAITVESNFDTISFDVTPFADENEHILYVEVADIEGNVGESEKIDVVITEFPGWRIYNDLIFRDAYDTPIVIDNNGLMLIGSGSDLNGFYIFNPETDELRNYTPDNSPLISLYVIDLQLIEDGRVWIANRDNVTEFLYDLNHWGRIIELPLDYHGYKQEISTIVMDNDGDLWVGTWFDGLFNFKGTELINHYFLPDIPSHGIHDLVVNRNNTLFVAPEDSRGQEKHGVFSIDNGNITTYGFFNDIQWELVCIAVDSFNNIWVSQGDAGFKYDGNTWKTVEQPTFGSRFFPMLVTKEGILFTQGWSTGLISWDGAEWTDYKNYDSPFKDENDNELHIAGQSLTEAPNGDIWMVVGSKLMRYRPSLGEYP
jgi:hypothetical protein